jgi:hypothetical protein
VKKSNKQNGVQVRKKSVISGIPGGTLRKRVRMATEGRRGEQAIF